MASQALYQIYQPFHTRRMLALTTAITGKIVFNMAGQNIGWLGETQKIVLEGSVLF